MGTSGVLLKSCSFEFFPSTALNLLSAMISFRTDSPRCVRANYVNVLCLSFLMCKMGAIIAPSVVKNMA